MKAKDAMELFEKGMREERKALATRQTYRSHVCQFLAFSKNSSGSLDADETTLTPLRHIA